MSLRQPTAAAIAENNPELAPMFRDVVALSLGPDYVPDVVWEPLGLVDGEIWATLLARAVGVEGWRPRDGLHHPGSVLQTSTAALHHAVCAGAATLLEGTHYGRRIGETLAACAGYPVIMEAIVDTPDRDWPVLTCWAMWDGLRLVLADSRPAGSVPLDTLKTGWHACRVDGPDTARRWLASMSGPDGTRPIPRCE